VTTIVDLAAELGVEPGIVAVYVDQLIGLDGTDAVVAGEVPCARHFPTGDRLGWTEAVDIVLTDEAVDAIREQVAAQRESVPAER